MRGDKVEVLIKAPSDSGGIEYESTFRCQLTHKVDREENASARSMSTSE